MQVTYKDNKNIIMFSSYTPDSFYMGILIQNHIQYKQVLWLHNLNNWILTKPSTTNHWEVLWINRTRITLDQTDKNRDNFLKKVFLNNIQMETVITTEQNSQFKEITRIIRNNKNKKTVSSGTFHIWDSHSCKNNSFSRTQLSVTEKLLRCSS